MTRLLPDRHADWHLMHDPEPRPELAADARLRLATLWCCFAILLTVVVARVFALEWLHGDAYRVAAGLPHEHQRVRPAPRGRILSSDGVVLARDTPRVALAMHYRYLEDPPDPGWLRSMARKRLKPSERRSSEHRRRAEAEVRVELSERHRELAALCGLSLAEWERRAERIQRRVESIAAVVVARRRASYEQQLIGNSRSNTNADWASRFWSGFEALLAEAAPAPSPGPITIAEELDYHVIAEGLPLEVVARIEADPGRYAGVRLIERSERSYPRGPLAAHILGYLGRPNDDEREAAAGSVHEAVGRQGIEFLYDEYLRGQAGLDVESTDSRGRVLSRSELLRVEGGGDVVLTIDTRVQQAAESLLDAALSRRRLAAGDVAAQGGGAAVVMEVHSGAILAAASAPRFDPNDFAQSHAAAISALMDSADDPLLNRPTQMALPPGSIFKVVSAVALLAEGTVAPEDLFDCHGFYERPDRERCAQFIARGVGHGPVDLSAALAQSCNVYFFHYATQLGGAPLADWARRFGFGAPSGVDLPYEVVGRVPRPISDSSMTNAGEQQPGAGAWQAVDTRALAIGQSTLEVTPVQVARMMAAIANGGELVTPHVARPVTRESDSAVDIDHAERERTPPISPSTIAVEGLDRATLNEIRGALRRVVADELGTGNATVEMASVAIAGKTGTAQTGRSGADHAWFAGYAPYKAPKFVVVVALEEAGSGGAAAGPVARRLVQTLATVGLLRRGS